MSGYISQSLPELFLNSGLQPKTAVPNVRITGIALDSRQVQPGNLFVALMGGSVDGHRFIPDALQRGAAAVIGTQNLGEAFEGYVQVDDARLALAWLSAAFYRFPARRMTVIGVTGTDGKTTTANLIYQILMAAGLPAGIISTVNAQIGEEVVDTGFHVTTPEAPDIQRYLARMAAAGLTHVVLEATSHGLAQHRVTGCEFDIGVITNITHEHLDFHSTYASYREAKARLFTSLGQVSKPGAIKPAAILNRDDSSYDYLKAAAKVRQASYSLHAGASVWAGDVHFSPSGSQFTVHGPTFSAGISTHLIGLFNVSNCLAAIAAASVGLEIDLPSIQKGIAALVRVPGRMESIDLGQDFLAIVDFAHTPNALKVALETARQMTGGRVLAVFGSAGLRDREKRRMMAEVSARLADVSILTAEDPRTEPLEGILAEMAAGAQAAGGTEGQTYYRIPDRGEAIRQAVRLARPGDLVIACGKGHEQSMCFGEVEYAWDDRQAIQAALAELLGMPGPEMPRLPTSR
ncbi:UDP-N-acetylmuramoyl-L-alanyl-D-glutamate--2,6-diaminopimelate ligase [bacterium]|nr:MAG: UDP-N-acetylmuramoyl-L-alanyl-D-glutamate--2,6-diaminopimelate ligase [bacterium]